MQALAHLVQVHGYAAEFALTLTAVLRADAAGAAAGLGHFLPWEGHYAPTSAAGKSYDALLGLLCAALGRLDDAVAHIEDALTFCRCAGLRPKPAWSCFDYARALIRRDFP